MVKFVDHAFFFAVRVNSYFMHILATRINLEGMSNRVKILKAPSSPDVLTAGALEFLVLLHERFGEKRKELLQARKGRQEEIKKGARPDFLRETSSVRSGSWKVAPPPHDLQDRRVEITGPAEAKMLINALNSGAKVFMADLEDSLSPTWENVIQAQVALKAAVRKTLSFENSEGKKYQLNEKTATLVVRPRGWHLIEKNILIDGEAVSGGLFDFAFYFFHNVHETLKRGTGPYFYLPKMESHLEARLWNDVFIFSEQALGVPKGTIRATVLIETILAAFEMNEILYELKDHIVGLNAGRWDYIFSMIKKFCDSKEFILPDRAQVTMTVPFMKAYSELLVQTCHKRGAHAMGGMSAFIPNRKDMTVTENALKKVKEDKIREANAGFDGTWVAHPDLVPVAQAEFDHVLGSHPHQKSKLREDVHVNAQQLLQTQIDGGAVTEQGLRGNIQVAIQYIERWISGVGAAALHNLMEDAATAEIARAQVWQWIRHQVVMTNGAIITQELYRMLRDDELKKLKNSSPTSIEFRYDEAVGILDRLILNSEFIDFLTLLADEKLN